MTNQEIITALENDGFLVSTFVDTETFTEDVIFSKDEIHGQVDSFFRAKGVNNKDYLVLLANEHIEKCKTEYAAIKDRMSKNYDDFR
jgi:hypothetical protein